MIFRSPYPDVTIPDLPLTPFVLQHAERRAAQTAYIDGPTGRTLTFGQLADNVRRVAAGLAARGYRKGDVFAIVAPNSFEFAIAFHAIASIGGIAAPINPSLTGEEIAPQLRETGATCLLAAPDLLDRARQAADRSPVREFVVFGEAPGATPLATLLRSDDPLPRVAIDPREDVVVILCSSGTTGLSKAVQLTHRNLIAATCQFAATSQIGEHDTLPGHLPFFHIFGVAITLSLALARGARSVLVPRFELVPFLQLAQHHRITHAYLVPPIVLALAKQPVVDDYDLSSLTSIVCGAAPLGEEIARACATRLGCTVRQAYGMTETGPTHLAPDDADPSKIGTVGPCTPNTECKVVDVATGAELGPGQEGEIWVRTPVMMKGYRNRPDETARTIDADGWLHTGDVGAVDADGYLTVVDRLKDLIKYKGHQIAPAELEAVLLTHPAVADAAIVRSPDDEAGEVPKAFVVLKGEATPEELTSFVAARVAPYKKIRRVEFTDQIPKSPSGKILRRVLVEREWSNAPSLA
jgi:acyl-CoA synthetase (AMP-forming)/AMP-acid ligase II